MRFVAEGNHVFISAFSFGEIVKDSLNLEFRAIYPKFKFGKDSSIVLENDSLWVSINNPYTLDSLTFTYPGIAAHQQDQKIRFFLYKHIGQELEESFPDFVRQTYTSGGSIFIHTDPMALTNFFLLHKKNNSYYDNVFSYLPANVQDIEWDEYFRYGKKDFSALQVIMKEPGLRAAFWLTLLLFLLIYLFESKRSSVLFL